MQPKKKLSEIVKDMAGLKAQWANTKPAPDTDKPVPPGTYVCDLTDGTAFEASTGALGYKITLKVQEGEFAGRLIWHDATFPGRGTLHQAFDRIRITDWASSTTVCDPESW